MITKATRQKRQRHFSLLNILHKEPFLTDQQIARRLSVSVPTIRLDRIELGIRELRERVKDIADKTHNRVRMLGHRDMEGSLLARNLNDKGVAILETSREMSFEKTEIVRGDYIYSFAESTAISLMDADAALVKVANIKYMVPVRPGEKLIARASVKQIRNRNYIISVMIFRDDAEVFRGKFILTGM